MDDARIFVVRTTTRCNMACNYCYVQPRRDAAIDLDTVERLITQAAALDEPTIVFVWHGGEPLLMGLHFFETIVKIERRFPKHFVNAVQTNGLALHDGYVDFFARHSFRVAISIDIPRERHDANRRLRHGATGTFYPVVKNLEKLSRHGMPKATLAVIADINADAQDYVDTIEARQLDSLALNVEFGLARRTDETSAARLSALLQRLYDYSAGTDRPFSLREADAVIGNLRHAGDDYCWHASRFCGFTHNAIAENGDIFICCDKFIDGPCAEAKLGNIRTDRLADIYASESFHDLMHRLAAARSACTDDCPIGRFCRGGCVHDVLMAREAGAAPGERRRQVGCVARTALFRHIEQDFQATK